MTNIKSGIYKITNPTNQVYIGQSINLRCRLTQYMKLHSTISSQSRIFESLKLHNPKQHKYEIIEFCSVYELDVKEVYHKKHHIDTYGWESALFCNVYDTPHKHQLRVKQDNNKKYNRKRKLTQQEIEMNEFMKGTPIMR